MRLDSPLGGDSSITGNLLNSTGGVPGEDHCRHTRIVHAPSTSAAEVIAGPAENWSALAVLMAGTFMIVLDFFIVNVALPSMQSELHATAIAIEWVVVGYGLTFAACLIMGGRLGDRIGRRRTFSLGLGLFTLASAACGAAPDATILVAARLVQGVAGALISPNVLAIIGVVYKVRRASGRSPHTAW
jgi:MFS family permease